ncbi:hypothetical protein A1D22_04750 [Pasteurellaceae bacterium LFhippo2]|nr:hypothetical protein [Pasteurellaceae bacterium LFhippo2]
MQKIKLFMDPLCGWCYAATPVIEKLAQSAEIEVIPTGLFSEDGRVVSPAFAQHAWSNDQRIAQLTGQVFSEQYRDNLLKVGMPFNSFPIVVALTWVNQHFPQQELNAHHAIQKARYVEGRDTTSIEVLTEVLASLGFGKTAQELSIALQDKDLIQQAEQRIMQGAQQANQFAVRGVPAVFAETEQGWQQVSVY